MSEGMNLLCFGFGKSVVKLDVYSLGESLHQVWVGEIGGGWGMVELEGFMREVEGEGGRMWLWVGDRLVARLPWSLGKDRWE